jgi:hypothetical protein
MLASSILLIYYAFRKELTGIIGIALLFTLFSFALLDTYKHYTFRLLSENLAIFTLATFVYFVKLGFDNFKEKHQFLATFFLMVSVLIRPTLFPIAFLYVLLIFIYYLKNSQLKKKNIFGMLLFFFLGISTLGIRNYLVSGTWIFLPSEGISDSWKQLLALDLTIIYKKILFAIGFLSSLNHEYYPRPHWFLLILLYCYYLYNRIKNWKSISNSEIIFNSIIISFYVLTIMFVTIDSYGFRALLPIQFLIIGVSFLSVEKIIFKIK